MASLPGLFPGPADSEHDRAVHESSYMTKFNPSTYDSVPPKLRNNIKYSEVRTLLRSIHDLQEDHPLLPVTLKEIRESGGFGEKWAPISSEARAIAALKFLKLIIAINGTIYTQEAYKNAQSVAKNYIPTSGVSVVKDREGVENMVPSTNVMTSAVSWADIRQPSHPNPTSVLLLTAKHWPGPTLFGEIINADEHAIFFPEPCSALDIKLSSFDGEYGRLMGPVDGLDSLCTPLVVRLLTCDFTEEDTKLLMNDHYGLSKSARLRETAHYATLAEQHKALTLTCKASAVRMVHEDRVLTKVGCDILSQNILQDKIRIVHLVRDPRAILVTRLELKSDIISRVDLESKKEFAMRMSKSANTLRCEGSKFNIVDCIKNHCESYEHSVDRTDHLLYQVFGKSTNLQLLSGVKQFFRIRYEDIMATPTITIEKIYKWFGNTKLDYMAMRKLVRAIEEQPVKWAGNPNSNKPTSKHTHQNKDKGNKRNRRLDHIFNGKEVNNEERKRGLEYIELSNYENMTFNNDLEADKEEEDNDRTISNKKNNQLNHRRQLLYMNYKSNKMKSKSVEGVPDAYTPQKPKQEVAWSLLTERQLEVATKECGLILRRLEYATEADKEMSSDSTSLSLPAWAWTTIPPKKSLTLPSPAVKKKKYVYVKPESWDQKT